MPNPIPNPGEEQQDFINRCMADPDATSQYPDEGDRKTFCELQWTEGSPGAMEEENKEDIKE